MKANNLHTFLNANKSQKPYRKHYYTQTNSFSQPRFQAQLQLSNFLKPIHNLSPKRSSNIESFSGQVQKILPFLSVNHSQTRSIDESKISTDAMIMTGLDIEQEAGHQSKKQSAPSIRGKVPYSMSSKYKAQHKMKLDAQICKITNTEILNLYDQLEINYQLVSNHNLENSNNKIHEQHSTIETVNSEILSVELVGGEIKHQELYTLSKNIFDLFRCKFNYFKLQMRDKESPLLITFSHKDASTILGFKAYVSSTALYPNKFNADYIVSCKQFCLQADFSASQFKQEYLYISVYSNLDISLIITINFGVRTLHNPFGEKQKIKINYLPIQINDVDNNVIVEQKQTKLTQNLNMSPYRRRNQGKMRDLKMVEDVNRSRQVFTRNKNLKFDKISNILTNFKTGQLIKDYRVFQEYSQQKQLKLLHQQKIWLQLLNFISLMQQISTRISVIFFFSFSQERAVYEKSCSQRKSHGLEIIHRHYHQGQAFRLNDIITNYIQDQQVNFIAQKGTITCCIAHLRITAKTRAQNIISDFLTQTSLCQTLLQKHQSIINKIIRIQLKFRQLRRLKKNHRERIQKLIHKGIGEIIYELRDQMHHGQQQGHQRRTSQSFVVDYQVMGVLINEFQEKKRQLWWDSYKMASQKKNQKQITLNDLAAKFKQPKLYEIPNENELRIMITRYANIKRLL